MTRMKSKALSTLAVVLGVVAFTAVGGASQAAQPNDNATPVEEMSSDGAAQEQFAALIASLEAAGEDVIIDMVWYGDSGTIVVSPGYVPTAKTLAEASGVDVEIKTGNGFPYSDRAELETTAMRAVAKAHDIIFATRYDATLNALIITIYANESELGPGDLKSIEGAARSATKGSGIEIIVETTTEDPPMPQAAVQGGENYGSLCTGGFIGWRGSEYGIITAKHCTTKPSTYDGATTGSTYKNDSYDLRFTALSGVIPENKIKIGSSTYRTITSTGTPAVGMSICKYGKTTGSTCGQVSEYIGCLYTGGNTYACGMYTTTTRMSEGGDSGGPWYYNNRAYGILYGASTTQSCFTSISNIGQVGGAYVKTI